MKESVIETILKNQKEIMEVLSIYAFTNGLRRSEQNLHKRMKKTLKQISKLTAENKELPEGLVEINTEK